MRRSLCPALVLTVALLAACKKEAPQGDAPAAQPETTQVEDAAEKTKAAAAPEADVIEHPFLWRVESPDGKVSHLFGTIHIGIDAQSRLGDEVWQAFEQSRYLVLEADLTDPGAVSAMMRKDGKTLEEELGPEAWAQLQERLGATMAEGLQNMKASAAAALLMVKEMPMTAPMDMVLLQKAKSSGKELLYLEALADQQKLLDELMDAELVRQLLAHYDEMVEMSKKTLTAYEQGDTELLVSVTTADASWEDPKEAASSREKLLYGRNEAWIPKLEQWLAKGDVFVAVGAGHLPGERGVIELLRAKGYEITRVE